MCLQMLGHAEGSDLLCSKDGDHLFVGVEELLVLGILKLLLLDVGPESLDDLGSGELLALLGSDEVSKVVAEAQRFGQSRSLRHFGSLLVV